jgi:hypothetical protein
VGTGSKFAYLTEIVVRDPSCQGDLQLAQVSCRHSVQEVTGAESFDDDTLADPTHIDVELGLAAWRASVSASPPSPTDRTARSQQHLEQIPDLTIMDEGCRRRRWGLTLWRFRRPFRWRDT